MKGGLGRHLSHDYHPPTDGFLEMVIKSHGPLLSLTTLLRCLDSVLTTTEFAYIFFFNEKKKLY